MERKWLSKIKGFTLVEIAVVTLIMSVIFGALLMALHVGQLTTDIGSSQVDLEAEVRMLADWIAKDVRQCVPSELCANVPTTDYVKFNLWNWNNTSLSQVESDEYVEYQYNNLDQNLTRRHIVDGVIETEQNFTDITMSPFYTSYIDEATNSFDFSELCATSNRTLIVAIRKEKTVWSRPLNFTTVKEVRIRNE